MTSVPEAANEGTPARRQRLFGAGILITFVVLAAACGKPDPDVIRELRKPPRPLLVYQPGMKVAGLGIADTAETSHSIESYRGRIVVLEFWSCRSRHVRRTEKARQRLIASYEPRGVVYFAVDSNQDEYPSEIERHLADLGSSYTVLIDYEGDARVRFGITRTPHVVVLDRDGVMRFSGCPFSPEQFEQDEPQRADWLEAALDALLAGRLPDPAVRPPRGDKLRRRPLL